MNIHLPIQEQTLLQHLAETLMASYPAARVTKAINDYKINRAMGRGAEFALITLNRQVKAAY